ncbi:uncharacterized protein LOC110715997 [Chenopodium quinoa]|uniref:uncharacterized protein LOC110715997 n=1 Tax=Chenopodium quinoa TaxID=63459 RepID=UPI000B78A52F|nr:uncharacterized protein LOC110715997 [Chenopodium quinoa]
MLESELPQPQEKAMDWILYEESVMTPDPQEPEADFFSSQEEATHVSPEVPESTTFEKDVTIAEPNSAVLDKRRSLVWKEFLMIDMVECTDGKSRCICKHCQSSSFNANSRYGTGNMKRHLSKCTPYQNSLKNKGGATGKIFNQQVYRELVAKAIIKHGYAFSWVEHDGNRDIHAYLNADVKFITRK